MIALPEVVAWSSGQVGYSHCFWCSRELTIGDWLWGCANCHSKNFGCSIAFRRGQGEAVVHITDIAKDWPPDRSTWTPADDVVVP
jgi:hypothetical protein